MLALGIIIPILPKLIESFVDNDTASAARIFGLFGTAWALMQFFFSPILGALSDRFGRRPVVLLSNFGLALDYVLMALAPTLVWLFVGRVISGITSASISTAFAYIADVTRAGEARRGVRQDRRRVRRRIHPRSGARRPARRYRSAAAVLGRGGPELCQYAVWLADPAGVAAAGTPLAIALAERQSGRRAASAALRPRADGTVDREFFRASSRMSCCPSVYVLYATYRYGWDTEMVGPTLAVVGICAMVVQGAAIGPIVRRLGERRALLLGLACGAIGFLIFRRRADRPAVLARHPRDGAVGLAGAATRR